MDSDSFLIHIKTEDFYEDIVDDVEKWFDTSNYSEDDKRPFSIAKNKKKIDFFKHELGGKNMKEFAGHRAKKYECVIKRILKFNDYEDCLFNNKIILK